MGKKKEDGNGNGRLKRKEYEQELGRLQEERLCLGSETFITGICSHMGTP
jgi:hypothetical protein